MTKLGLVRNLMLDVALGCLIYALTGEWSFVFAMACIIGLDITHYVTSP